MNVIKVKLDDSDSNRLTRLEEKISRVEEMLQNPISEEERFLDKHQLQEMINFSETTLKEKIKAGLFPAPIEIFSRNRWLYSDVKNWMEKIAKIN